MSEKQEIGNRLYCKINLDPNEPFTLEGMPCVLEFDPPYSHMNEYPLYLTGREACRLLGILENSKEGLLAMARAECEGWERHWEESGINYSESGGCPRCGFRDCGFLFLLSSEKKENDGLA